ncbi:MAG: hypothetical protein R2838_19870 [Caldilineaceae bacterium]
MTTPHDHTRHDPMRPVQGPRKQNANRRTTTPSPSSSAPRRRRTTARSREFRT